MSTYKSYIDRFARSKSTKRDGSLESKLQTDKEAYTEFLEIQLERISKAILQVDNFNDKLQTVCLQVNNIEEKLSNSNKLVKLLQSFADGQEADNAKVQEKLEDIQRKQAAKNEDFEFRFQELEKKKNGNSHHEHDTNVNERVTTAATDHFSTFLYDRGGDRQERNGRTDGRSESIDRNLEQRIMDFVNQRFEFYTTNLRNFEERYEDYNEKFSKDVAMDIRTLENRMSEFIDRAGGRHGGGGSSVSEASLENLKEELYQKLEVFMDEFKNTPTMLDLEELRTMLDKEAHDRAEAVEHLEKYFYLNNKRNSTLGDDVTHKLEDMEGKLQDFQHYIHRGSNSVDEGHRGSSFSEKKFSEELYRLQKAVKEINIKISSLPADNYRSSEKVSQAAIDEVEKRLTDNMVDGFDRFSNIVKKHMEKSKKLEQRVREIDERVLNLEDNIPSRSVSRSVLKTQSKKYQSNPLYTEDDKDDFLSTKENPFLKGRLSSASKMNSIAGRIVEPEGRASFGQSRDSFKKSGTKLRSRSGSVSRSLSSSMISNQGGKENKSPSIRWKNENPLKRSAQKKRLASPSRSATGTPKRRDSVKSHESVGSRSNRKGTFEGSNKKSNIKQMQNKIEMERKLREEKIKKLIKQSKPAGNTPKFSRDLKKESGGTGVNTKSLKVEPKRTVTGESFDRNMKYDYNFTVKGDKFSSSHKDSRKY